MKEKLSKWLIGVHLLDILVYLKINTLFTFSFLLIFIIFIYLFCKYPQTRLEGVSSNKTGQFAVVLEVGSWIWFLQYCFFVIL